MSSSISRKSEHDHSQKPQCITYTRTHSHTPTPNKKSTTELVVKNFRTRNFSGKICGAHILAYFNTLKFNSEPKVKVKVKWSRYSPGVAQTVGRGIALLSHDRGTRREWVVSSTPPAALYPRERPGTHFTGGWVGPRAGLGGRKISSPPGFDPGPSSP